MGLGRHDPLVVGPRLSVAGADLGRKIINSFARKCSLCIVIYIHYMAQKFEWQKCLSNFLRGRRCKRPHSNLNEKPFDATRFPHCLVGSGEPCFQGRPILYFMNPYAFTLIPLKGYVPRPFISISLSPRSWFSQQSVLEARTLPLSYRGRATSFPHCL